MAIQIIPIIKAIIPLISASSNIVASLGERQTRPKAGVTEERITKLEEDLLQIGKVVTSAVEQLQATAQELRIQSELNESHESRLRLIWILITVSSSLSVAAIIVAILN
jgi:hypothetical protein